MSNPHLEQQPDYTQAEFAEARLIFTVEGRSDEEAAALLGEVWHFNHDRACATWDREQEALNRQAQEEREQAARDQEQAQAARQQESELAKQEERKKHKNKFLPILNRPLPERELLIPPQHALNKLFKGEYVPLYYFTNKGIREAGDEPPNLDDDVLTLVRSDQGPIFQSTAAAKAKDCKTPDENLTWDEFAQANHRMLRAMDQQRWPPERLQMMANFWVGIETHDFRHGECEYGQSALLLYQARTRKLWHQAIDSDEAFSLVPLSEYHIQKYQKELRDAALNAQIETLKKVSHSLPKPGAALTCVLFPPHLKPYRSIPYLGSFLSSLKNPIPNPARGPWLMRLLSGRGMTIPLGLPCFTPQMPAASAPPSRMEHADQPAGICYVTLLPASRASTTRAIRQLI